MEVFRFVIFWSHIILSTSLENLAYNKSATQSSNLHENKWFAGAAVDGNGNQILTGNSCACTAYFKSTVWWKVDLGNVYALSNVKIFYRNEGTSFRLTGFKLYVTLEDNFISSSPVYVNNNGQQMVPYLPANFTFTVATYGQYVTLYKDRSVSCAGNAASINTNYCALFELCEVEVLGCPPKKYGTNCQSDCPDNCLYDVCAVRDGKCYECKAGYTGDMCDQPCRAGTYGIGCLQRCSGNCKGGATCDVRDGTCLTGCSDGYKGNYCNETCSSGTYGSSCSSVCGSCKNDTTCNHVNGSCLNGCGLGVTGRYCKTACTPGKYGYNCNESCSGNCMNGVTCNVQTGYCDNGCTAGWKGDKCDTGCNSGTYGLNCLLNCNVNCANGSACNRIDGFCQYGCKSGWKGNKCDQVCENGKYGSGCIETCGRCINRMNCDRQTGACKQGCADGYEGTLCRKRCIIGFYGPNCTLKCIKCTTTCDYVNGECPVSGKRSPTDIQDMKLPLIVYGVISAVIICILSVALVMCFLRKNFSHRSENHINIKDFEFSMSDKSDPKDDSGDRNNIKSGNTLRSESSGNHKSNKKYEELGTLCGERNNYESLEKGEESTHQHDQITMESCNKTDADDVGSDDKTYEQLHTNTAENTYESLSNDGNTQYANA